MTRNSIALMRDGSVMADSDLVDFWSGPTDSAINFNGSADLHTPIHPPLEGWFPYDRKRSQTIADRRSQTIAKRPVSI